jgi:hypothetical protein
VWVRAQDGGRVGTRDVEALLDAVLGVVENSVEVQVTYEQPDPREFRDTEPGVPRVLRISDVELLCGTNCR